MGESHRHALMNSCPVSLWPPCRTGRNADRSSEIDTSVEEKNSSLFADTLFRSELPDTFLFKAELG